MLDLSRWLDGDYVIPGKTGEAGSTEGAEDAVESE